MVGDMQQDSIFREKAGQQRQTGQRRGADQKEPVGRGHLGAQVAHFADVQLAVRKTVHDVAGGQEKKRLEEGMGNKVKDGEGVGADADAEHHGSPVAKSSSRRRIFFRSTCVNAIDAASSAVKAPHPGGEIAGQRGKFP